MISPTSLEKFTQGIEKRISEGHLELALEQLHSYLQGVHEGFYDKVIELSGRYNRTRRTQLRGKITDQQANDDFGIIKSELLKLLNQIPNSISAELSPASALPIEIEIPPLNHAGLEKIIGANNLKQIAWIEQGLRVAKSVCRILTPKGLGTGFLIAPDLLMTNNHVIPTLEVAKESIAEFNYQLGSDGNIATTYRYNLEPSKFYTSPSEQLDCTIVGIQPNDELSNLLPTGFLTLNPNAKPIATEHVTIIQHPNGGPKQIALTANQIVSVWEHKIHYTTDTMPGSSGSPVFNDSWQVIAIHHAGGDLQSNAQGMRSFINEGILMSAIKGEVGDLWPHL